ncbi:MAG: hypothetical protein ACNA7E_07275 [Wenzhouxiangellaceae bacterium]
MNDRIAAEGDAFRNPYASAGQLRSDVTIFPHHELSMADGHTIIGHQDVSKAL